MSIGENLPLVGLMLLVGVIAAPQTVAAGPAIRIAEGAGRFVFVDEKGDASKEISVYTYLPAQVKASDAPIVFVMHGHHKTAKGYRDDTPMDNERYLPGSDVKGQRERFVPMSIRLRAAPEMLCHAPDGEEFGPDAFVFGTETGKRINSIKTAWRLTWGTAQLTTTSRYIQAVG